MIADFFKPYLQALYGAAYSLQQTLDGYGLSSTNFIEFDAAGNIVGSYWSTSEAVIVPFGYLVLCSILLAVAMVSAGFVLGRIKGALITVIMLSIPGILNILGMWPAINYMPESYQISGTGVLGEAKGFLPLLIIGLLSGWALVVIVYDTLNLNDKFRNSYDHFWYCSALLAGLFFIVDTGANKNQKDLAAESQNSRQASAYLQKQLANYHEYCKSRELLNTPSCQWASDVQQKLSDYTYYDVRVFHKFGPKDSREIYAPLWSDISDTEILNIRREIKAYNDQECPVTEISETTREYASPSTKCQVVPPQFCQSFPEPPKGLIDEYIIGRTVAIASECIVPTLIVSRKKQENLSLSIEEDAMNKHVRWSYFVLFSLLVGGKVANATTKLSAIDSRDSAQRQRLIPLIRWLFKPFVFIVLLLMKVLNSLRNLALKRSESSLK